MPPDGVATGTYQAFAALVQHGTLADNRVDPGDILAIDVKTVTFSTGLPNGSLPFLSRPFIGDYPTGSFFDHVYPQEFVGATGLIVPYWGEQLDFPVSRDVNHEG